MILECRTECVERNQGVIVRVHLEEIMVHVGLCRNLTSSSSQVTPYICDRKIGVWTFDENSVGHVLMPFCVSIRVSTEIIYLFIEKTCFHLRLHPRRTDRQQN
ncbi:unnamed protein product [Enterobius vermicularis]|uniref:Ovule protein n=1 Tax=Enterobius vermicularis TaxID=51028 RepID=A0A0N4V7H6_ENTVE|nr:unnamed protein product [Enterobius vermicularis]